MTGSSGGKGGVLQAFFMGKRVDWSPALDVASKAVEVGGEMPLGVRFERREDGASKPQLGLQRAGGLSSRTIVILIRTGIKITIIIVGISDLGDFVPADVCLEVSHAPVRSM